MENDRTFAEINRTVQENIRPTGSMIRCNVTGDLVIDLMCHSNNVVEEYQIDDRVLGTSKISISHIVILATDEIDMKGFIIVINCKIIY